MKDIFPKIPLIFAVAIFLLFSGSFYLLYNKITDNNVLAEENTIKHLEQIRKVEEIQMLNRGIKAVETEAALVDTHFGKNADLVPFLDTMENLGTLAGAKAETTSVEVIADGSAVMLGMKAEGSFESLYKYLTLLENSPYRLEFVSVNFAKMEKGAWEAEFMIKLISFIK